MFRCKRWRVCMFPAAVPSPPPGDSATSTRLRPRGAPPPPTSYCARRGAPPPAPPRSFLAERGELQDASKGIPLRPRESPTPDPSPLVPRGEGRIRSPCGHYRVASPFPHAVCGGRAGDGGPRGRSSMSVEVRRSLHYPTSPGSFGGGGPVVPARRGRRGRSRICPAAEPGEGPYAKCRRKSSLTWRSRRSMASREWGKKRVSESEFSAPRTS